MRKSAAPEPQQERPQRGYSPKATAERLDLSLRTVMELIAQGKIRATKVSARRRAITDIEIARILQHGIDGA